MPDINVSGSDSGSGSTPSAAQPTATPSAPAAPSATPTGTAPAPTQQHQQVPDGYVPSYRLRETREAAQREFLAQAAQQQAEANARYAEMERKFQALAGIVPPPDPNQVAVRNQFSQLYPGLAKLEERADDLLAFGERAGDLDTQAAHYWQNYGRTSMDRLFDTVQRSLGTTLNDESKRVLHSSFVGFVSQSPEMTARYANDPTIVEDFARAFTSSFIDPARRVASAGIQERAQVALPRDTPGGAPRSSPVPSTKGESLDDRVNKAWVSFQTKTNQR